MYGFDKNQVPEPYVKIDWTDKMERTKYDYGDPPKYHSPYPPGDELSLIEGWESEEPIY